MSPRPSRHRSAGALRALSFVVLSAVLAAGLGLAGSAAHAVSGASDSQVTIAWNGEGNDEGIQALQPARDDTWLSEKKGLDGNPHVADFADLEIEVSKTTGLGDELVEIDVSGMPGGTVGSNGNLPGVGSEGRRAAHQQNFLQVMQCWGDPTAANFRETCQWGGVIVGGSDLSDVVPGFASNRGDGAGVPLTSVQQKQYYVTPPSGSAGLGDIVTASTTNELLAVPVKADGTASFGFDVQTSVRAPWLGCGAPTETGELRSCSIVIVPRGTIYGGEQVASGGFAPDATYGDVGAQVSSPIDPAADHWDNRIVVPLEFERPIVGCGTGTTRLVGGSQLLTGAMTSWQRALCDRDKLAFSFATSADAQARSQLAQGAVGMAYTTRSVRADELGEGGSDLLAEAELVYAPVAAAGMTVSFQYINENGPVTDLKLTPRLIAKLLTQSYTYGVPDGSGGHTEADGGPHLTVDVKSLIDDPEFLRLNPHVPRGGGVGRGFMGDLVVAGPAGADGYRLLWEYLLADTKARAFLAGEPDNALPGDAQNRGLTVNPYYLPAGDARALAPAYDDLPYLDWQGVRVGSQLRFVRGLDGTVQKRDVGMTDADGSPLALAQTPIDTVPRADQSMAPGQITIERTRFDSIAYNPYAESLEHVAQRLYRAENKRPIWDTNAFNGSETGAWKARPREWGTRVRIMGVTDVASAEAYGLATAQLQLPDSDVFVAPSTASLTAALSAHRRQDDTQWLDFAALSDDAYPLTLLTYAATNLPATDADARQDFADLIEYAVTEGQAPGEGSGQLPAGYAPLTEQLRAEAVAAVQRIRAYVNPIEESTPDAGDVAPAAPTASSVTPTGAQPADAAAESSSTQTAYSASNTAESTATPASPATGALGGALIAGAAAAILAPFLLRRRRTG